MSFLLAWSLFLGEGKGRGMGAHLLAFLLLRSCLLARCRFAIRVPRERRRCIGL